MGSIEIKGKSGRIERVYFEVKQSRLAQWNEAQIKVRMINRALMIGRLYL